MRRVLAYSTPRRAHPRHPLTPSHTSRSPPTPLTWQAGLSGSALKSPITSTADGAAPLPEAASAAADTTSTSCWACGKFGLWNLLRDGLVAGKRRGEQGVLHSPVACALPPAHTTTPRTTHNKTAPPHLLSPRLIVRLPLFRLQMRRRRHHRPAPCLPIPQRDDYVTLRHRPLAIRARIGRTAGPVQRLEAGRSVEEGGAVWGAAKALWGAGVLWEEVAYEPQGLEGCRDLICDLKRGGQQVL